MTVYIYIYIYIYLYKNIPLNGINIDFAYCILSTYSCWVSDSVVVYSNVLVSIFTLRILFINVCTTTFNE